MSPREGPDFPPKTRHPLRKPNYCPHCGLTEGIGQLDMLESETDEEYERLGGRWYCVTCGWGEDIPRDYTIVCFNCGEKFPGYESDTEFCPTCHFTVCPNCGACKCSLCEREQLIIDRIWETVSPLVRWWLSLRGRE